MKIVKQIKEQFVGTINHCQNYIYDKIKTITYLYTLILGLTSLHTSIISNPIFSPSRSASVHITKVLHNRTSRTNVFYN